LKRVTANRPHFRSNRSLHTALNNNEKSLLNRRQKNVLQSPFSQVYFRVDPLSCYSSCVERVASFFHQQLVEKAISIGPIKNESKFGGTKKQFLDDF
jgi:hypothetical protein